MYKLNDGLLSIYVLLSDSKTAGGTPNGAVEFVKKAWYADLGINSSEYYEAEMADTFIERRVRILQDKSLTRQNVIVIGDKQYRVGRIWSGRLTRLNKAYDEFALGAAFTDITLERIEKDYNIEV